MKIGISACLLGYRYRYDGSHRKNKELIKLLNKHELIPICPEFSAGFPIPHDPIELKDEKAFFINGTDVSDKLMKGCHICFAKIRDCDLIILKGKSPSCGYKKIYDGSFSGKLIDGNGMFTSICLKNDLKVFSDEDIESIKGYIDR